MKKKFGRLAKTVSCFVLSAFMVLTLLPTNITTAFAQDAQGFTIKVNNVDSTLTNDIHVVYGDTLAFTLEGKEYKEGEGDLKFLRLDYPNDNPPAAIWEEIKTTTQWPVGAYYLGYEYFIDENNNWENGNGDFKVTVDKDTVRAPGSLSWQNGTTAKWGAVTTTTHGRSVEVSDYTVSLFKEGVATALATETLSDTEYDFSSVIGTQAEGSYYFKVSANASDTVSYNNSQAAQSPATHKVKLTLAKGSGIASVNPTASFFLISGNSTTQTISATPTAGGAWDFLKWTSSDSGVNFADSFDSSTTVSIPSAYDGSNLVTITANGADVVAPVISSFSKKSGSHTQLTATAVDNETGIAAYAFSTAANAGDVGDDEWVEVSKAAGEALTVDFALSAKGNYYFYVTDNHDNIQKSNSDILVSKIIYNNYTLASDYLIGTGDTLTLPTNPTRSGWEFNGWFDSDTLDNQITQLTNPDTASDINVYAKWTRQAVSFKTQPQPYSAEYDGAEHSLTVAVNNTSGTITYQWYKKGTDTDTAIEGATSNTYNVKNFADSGSYYVIVSIEDDGGEVVTGTSNTVAVAITKAELTVTADSDQIYYKDAAPAYTAQITGYKGADTEGVVTKGTITSSYKQGDKADEYAIVPAGYAADNYNFKYVNGKLTVKPLDVNALGSQVTVTFVDPSAKYYYDGTAKVPAIAVKDGEDTISTDNYTVSYSPDNIHAGTVTLTVAFKQSYKGSLSLTFTIDKRTETPTVVMSDWTYDGTAHAPSVTGYAGTAIPVYYYKAASATEYTTTAPVNAGNYSVYAVIPATDDDNGYTTAVVNYEIKKVNITIKAPTNLSYVFDGTAHLIDQNYTVTGAFVGTDAIKATTYVYAKDSTSADVGKNVILAGNYTTHVYYELTATTVASNYNIVTVDGTCTVGKATLNAPSDVKWSTTTAGKADWLAVVADNVTIKYDVVLYKEGQTAPVKTVTNVEDSEYDFSSDIQGDCETAGAAGGYYFKVKAKVSGGTAAANYLDSNYSENSSQINTVAVQLVNAGGIGSLNLGGITVTSGQTVFLFSGQTVSVSAQAAMGYTLAPIVWTTESSLVSIENDTLSDTNITISVLSAPGTSVQQILAHAGDNPPQVTSFTGTTNADRTKVTLNLKATDALGIAGYMIKKDDATQPDPSASGWTAWSTGDLDVNYTVTESGTYYAFIKDTSGNVVKSDVNIVIYKVEFSGGNGSVGTMTPILKIQNISEKIPANVFTKEGYTWVGWNGSTGAYSDESYYDANANDTLEARWDINSYQYTVNYYLEDAVTGYPKNPSSTATFEATHGTTVTTSTEAIQLSDLKGMTVDPDHAASITVIQNGLSIDVYYKLNTHTVTYTYTDTEGKVQTFTETHKYGTALTERPKPDNTEGWVFKGWDYGLAGSLPATMPDYDINVTGEFVSTSTHYDIIYFEQNLDGTYREVNTAMTSSVHAIHGNPITADGSKAGTISAFTYKGVIITYGKKGSTTPSESDIQASAEGFVDAAHHTYINYYYTRNSYKITLKVYKRDSDNNITQLYTHEFPEQLYGTPITASYYENYGYTAIPGDIGSGWGEEYENIEESGYKIETQATWTIGSTPTTQPSCNAVVSRYIVEQTPSFFVETYFEKTDGSYALESKNLYTMNPDETELTFGQHVSIGSGSGATVDYTSSNYKKNFKYSNYLDFFEFDTEKNATDGVLSGTVKYSENESGYLTLKIYFKRLTKKMTIEYYYDDNCDGRFTKFYTATWENVRWGDKRYAEITALFDSGENWVNGEAPTTHQAVSGQESWVSFNFRENNYMVKYSDGYTLENIGYGDSHKVETESALRTATVLQEPVGQSNTSIRVYYYALPIPELVYIDMQWKYSGDILRLEDFRKNVAGDYIEGKALDSIMPITYEYGGTTYKVRVVSEPYVFADSTYQAAISYSEYPALNILNGTWTNGSTLKPGFSQITIGTKNYYISTDGTDNYIYYLRDKVFTGGSPWFSYPTTEIGAAEINTGKVNLYASTYSTKGTPKYDAKAKFVYLNTSRFSNVLTGNDTYTLSVYYYPTRRIYHSINGLRCEGHLVKYYGTATGDDLVCEDVSWTNAPEGYSPVWFLDSSLLNPVTETSTVSMNGTDQFLYGKFVLATLNCYDWAFYRVLRPIKNTAETKTYTENSYLTEAQIEELVDAEDPKLVVTTESTQNVKVNDSLGIPRSYTITTTKYVLDGQLVAVKRNHPVIAFSSTSMNWTATDTETGQTVTYKDSDFNSYYTSGYAFSSTDSRNLLSVTVGGTATSLKKYYTYTWPTYTVNNNYQDKLNTPTKTQPHYGKIMTLETPSETGYAFAGWVFTRDNGTEWTAAEGAPTWSEGQSSVTFIMPSFNITATAQWNDAKVDTMLTHYFQTVTGDYDKNVTEGLTGGTTVAVSYEGGSYSGTLYDNGVVTVSDTVGHTSYFKNAKLSGGVYMVVSSELRAVRWTAQKVNHSKELANADVLPSSMIPHYSYSYTVRRTSSSIKRYEGTDTISYGNGVSVDLFYARESELQIRTVAFSMAGSEGVRGAIGGTIVGDGSYNYYKEISAVVTLNRGYSIDMESTVSGTTVGWYKAEDVLKDYVKGSSTPLTEYELKDDLTGLSDKCLCAKSDTYTFNVEESADLVVLVMPKSPNRLATMITGKQRYVYDYVDDAENTINVTYSEFTGGDGTTIVTSYNWYIKNGDTWNLIDGYHTATYNVPTGKSVGNYTYKCELCLSRTDNGNSTTTFTDEYTITVEKGTWSVADLNLEVTPYTGVYDKSPHGITVTVLKPTDSSKYTKYYRVGTPIVSYEECSDPDVSTTAPTKTDVGEYTVYYYIHSEDGNYNDAKGNSTISITPAVLTLKATNKPYTKTYDGTTNVNFGDITRGTTGYYTVEGLYDGDSVTVNGSAVFNGAHVATATAVTLSDLVITDNGNYALATGYTCTIPAAINTFVVNGTLGNKTTTYNGKLQKPVFNITAGQTIPDSGLKVLVGGATDAGEYTVDLTVDEDSLTTGQVTDYSVNETSGDRFVINPVEITVTPKPRTVEYDGTTYTLNDYTVTGTLISGQSVKAIEMASEYTNAGTYSNIAISKAYVKDADNNDYTDNYAINYGSNTLTITQKPVVISGITAKDKVYDGNKKAELVLNAVQFEGMVSGDELSLDANKVFGEFNNEKVYQNKYVYITYEEGALIGASAANYVIDEDSQKTAKASILSGTIKVSAQNLSVTYGDTATFTPVYTGMISGEISSVVKGTPTYQISSNGTDWFDYAVTASVGEYYIRVNTSGLSADNYVIVWDNKTEQKLTVNRRQITVTEKSDYTAPSKVYDGTTNVPSSIILSNYYTVNNVVNGDDVGLSFTKAFNSKDVATANQINVSNLAITNTNYELASTGNMTTIKATITQKDLTVTIASKNITYGDSAPAYTYSLSGLVSGESDNKTMTLGCTYDVSAAATRHVGTYDITPTHDYVDGNYDITYANSKKGTLTVGAKGLTVTAKPKTITYGEAPNNDGVSYSGFVFGEDETTALTGNLSYSYTYAQYGAAGTYKITASGLSNSGTYANYSITYPQGKLTVNKKDLTISGITSTARDYDKTKAANLVVSGATYSGLEANDDAYKLDGTASGKMSVAGTYADKNAGTDKTVTLKFTAGTYIGARYNLKDCQTTTSSTVNKINATVTADKTTIQYGKPVPTYKYTEKGFLSGETALTDYTGDKFTLSGTYVPEDTPVGTYTNAITFNVGTYVNKNYNINFVPGDIEVTNNKFQTPSPKFNVGTVSWSAIADVAGVSVKEYSVKLYLNDGATPVYTDATTATSVDLDSTIRLNGAGKYTFKVQAITADDTKVSSSAVGTATTYAATVTFVYADDEITQAGSAGCSATIGTASGLSGCLVIAGQKNVALNAGIKNSTGYGLNSCSITTGKGLSVKDSSVSGTSYTGKLDAAQTMAITSGVVTISLKATQPTAEIDIEGNPSISYYGYPSPTPEHPSNPTPKVQIKTGYPKASDGDTYTGYTYTYKWQIKFGLTYDWHDIDSAEYGSVSADNRTYTFPTGKNVGSSYKVRCLVTATRADNGQSITVGESVLQTIVIKRADFSSVVSLDGWQYGTAHKTPSVSQNPGGAEVTYYYSDSPGLEIEECTTVQSTEAGVHYVKAVIHESDKYAEYTTAEKAFTITQGQLVMTTPTYAGGSSVGSWTAPASIYEAGDPTKHEVKAASYDVALYKKGTGGTWTKISGTEHNVTGLSYDFTEDILAKITTEGVYTFGVAAKSDDPTNVLDSAEVKYSGVTLLATTVTDLSDSVQKTTKEYNKVALRIQVVLSSGITATSYNWYKDGVAVSDVTTQTCDAVRVADGGVYVAAVKNGSNTVAYTIAKKLTINKKPLTLYWPPKNEGTYAGKYYNYAPGYTVTDICEGDIVDFNVEGNKQKDAGTYTTIASIKAGKDGGNYYIAEPSTHVWYIYPRTIVLDWSNLTFTYDKTAHKPTATVNNLVDGDICTITVTGEKTDAGIYTATATAVSNSNYKLPDAVTQQFTINQKEASLKWGTTSFVYNGENQKPTCLVDNLESGDVCDVTVDVSGTHSTAGNYTATATALSNSNYKLPASVTKGYEITTRRLSVTWPENNTFTYDKTEKTYEPTLGNKVGSDVVNASLQNNKKTEAGDYTTSITGLTGKDAANYHVDASDSSHAWSIGKKTATLNWENLTFTYDKNSHCPTATVTNKETGDEVYVTVTGAQTNAGTYTATATGLTGANASQYQLPAEKTKQFTINPKEIGISWTNLEFTYDGNNHKPTATATGVETGDTVNITVSGEQKNASATAYTATADSIDNSNYKLPTAVTKGFTINPREIAIAWGTTSFTYNGSSQCPTATVSNLVAGDTCTISVTGGKTNSNYVDGSTNYTATAASIDGASKTNYVLPTANTTTFTIARKDIAGATITLGAALTYTGAELTQKVSKVVIDGLEATFEVSNNKQTKAGTYSGANALKVTGTGNFTGTETKEFTIAQAANTWTSTPSIADWTYGGSASTPVGAAKFGTVNVTYYGTADDGTAYAESTTPPTKAGSYTVKFVVTETTDYTGLSTTVNFTVKKKEIGVTWTNTTLTYNGSEQKPVATATGLVGTDEVLVTVTGAQKDANAKTGTTNYTATADAITGAQKDNYKLPDPKPTTTFTIGQKEVGVTWTNTALTYNGSEQKPVATATGIEGTDAVSVTVTGGQVDANAKTATTGYTATADALTGTDAQNYKLPIAKPTTVFTIAQKEVGISWTDTELTYNGKAQQPTATATGLIGKDTAAITVSGEKTDSNAKAGQPSYTAMAIAIDNGNYKLPTENTTTFTIAQKSIVGATVNLGPQLKFTGLEQEQTVESVIIDGLNATFDVSNNKATNVGEYTLTVTGTGNFKDSSTKKFTITSDTNEWTIEPAMANWTYGDEASNPVGEAKYGNDKLTITYAGTLQDGTAYAPSTTKPGKAGSYTATFTVPASKDYPILTKTVNFSIYQREVTIAWGSTEFTYDGTSQKPQATAGNLVSGDTVTVTVNGEETYTNEHTGRIYTATATDLSNVNYKLPETTPATGFTIGQREVTLTWTDLEFIYDGNAHKPTATAGNLIGTDSATVTVSGAKENASSTAYTATATKLSNKNYKLPADNTKEFTIGRRTVTITWPDTTEFEYNGIVQNITPEIGNLVNSDSVSLVVSGDKAKDASENHKATVTGLSSVGNEKDNYKLPDTGLEKNWKITPKVVTLIWDYCDNLVYNGQPQCPGAIVSNVCPGDTCNVSNIEGAETDSNAKSGQPEYLAYATGLDNSNYKLPDVAEISYKIKRKEVGLSWNHTNDLVYNGENQKPEAVATGLCGTDTCTVTVTGEQKNVGTGYVATATKLSDLNYILPSGNTTTFSISKKAATVNIGSASKKYDGQALTCNDFSTEGFIGDEGIDKCVFGSSIIDAGAADNEYIQGTSTVTTKKETDLGNYEITWNKGTLTIEKRNVTLTSGSAKKVYDGVAVTNTDVSEGEDCFVSDEGVVYNVTGTQTNAGESDNRFTYEFRQNTKEGNYNITTAFGKLEVTPAEITITADDQTSKRITEEIKPLTGKITKGQLYGTDKIKISGTTTATKTSPVGVYEIVPTYEFIEGTLASNYTVTLVNGKYTLEKTDRGQATIEMEVGEGVKAQFADTDAALKACLNEEDEQSMTDGKNIQVKLCISYLSDGEVPASDKTAIENQIKNSGIENLKNGRYMSITVFKKVGDGEWTAVTEVKSEFSIILTIPDDMLIDGATYYIGRVHGTETATLKDTDKAGKTITFASDKFSTYALEYAKKADDKPVTSDANDPWKWVFLMGLSAVVMGAAAYTRRRRASGK